MKHRIALSVMTLIALQFSGAACAATLPGTADAALLPDNPTSADTLKLSIRDRTCVGAVPYKANPYRVSMSQNNITVTLGEHVTGRLYTLCQSFPREEFDIGKLPPGSYTVTVIEDATGETPGALVDKAPFTVADARAAKGFPYVRLDYSGHWWDPNDSGWGLFIWQDARSNTDSIMAAWFTYTPDGNPMWYVFQPTWRTSDPNFPWPVTNSAPLAQVSRFPGATSPPPTARATLISAGSASLDFSTNGTGDVGKITYTFNGGPTLVRNIQRFKP